MMKWMKRLRSLWRKEKPGKRVALVLSGGGARGIAHIGAIEELQARGYEITSVAGTSMGAMVGGALAAGKLEELKREALSMKRMRVLGLIDLSPRGWWQESDATLEAVVGRHAHRGYEDTLLLLRHRLDHGTGAGVPLGFIVFRH